MAQGFCHGAARGVAADAQALEGPQLGPRVVPTHDGLARFIADVRRFAVLSAPPRSTAPCPRGVGIRAADIMFGVTDSNRAMHDDWLGLALFSAIFAANMRGVTYEPFAGAPPRHAVRAGA